MTRCYTVRCGNLQRVKTINSWLFGEASKQMGQYSAVYRKSFNYDRVYIYSTDILIYIKKDKSCFSFSSEQVDVFSALEAKSLLRQVVACLSRLRRRKKKKNETRVSSKNQAK